MRIKVTVNDDGSKLIRESDGKQIGEVLIPFYSVEHSLYLVDGQTKWVQFGYVDSKDEFHKLCTAEGCSLECLNKQKPNCRYSRKGGDSQGMYIDS